MLMKLEKKSICCFSLVILFTGITGCGSVSSVEPLGGGYEEVIYTRNSISEPSAHQITLQYRKPDGGLIMVWPSVRSYRVKKDMAVFVGNEAYEQPDPDDPQATRPRLFLVRAPDLPLDVSEEILWRQAKQSGGDLTKLLKKQELLKKINISYVGETNSLLELRFGIEGGGPYGVLYLDWNQISDIMREVKEKGVVRKDRVWGTSYIEKEFNPEEPLNSTRQP